MRRLSLILLLPCSLPALAADPRGVLHTLDYLSVDYPGAVENGQVANELEYAEQVEFAGKLIDDLTAGGLTWLLAGTLIDLSGIGRELTEGLTALLAAAVLLYVGFWRHGKAHARRWKEYVRERIHGALQGRTLWLLSGLAFLAVYREVFETVLFYQALLLQAGGPVQRMIWLGLASGVLLLLLIAYLWLRLGRRLPARQFFIVNAWILLLALAVSLVGHGLAAMQEAGWLSVHPLSLPRWDLIGLYPTVETTLAQLALVALIVWLYRRQNREAE